MKNYLEYKGYIGSVEYSDEDSCLFGKVLGIRNLISYEGTSVAKLKHAFKEMVDCYLNDCKADNIKPEKPYKGSLNVRIGSDTHRILAILAQSKNVSINHFINDILAQYIKRFV